MKKPNDNAYFFTFFTTLDLIWSKFFLKTTPTLISFARFQWNMLGNSIDIKNFNWNPVVLKFFAKTSKNYHFSAWLVKKWGPHGPYPKTKNNIYFRNNKTRSLSFQNLFILTKYNMFWLSYECFSISCDAFLLKSVISSHSITAVLY